MLETTNEVGTDCGEQVSIPKLLTVEEIAALLRVPHSWIYDRTRISKSNGFPVLRVGKYLRFEYEKVVDYLQKQ